MQTGWNAKVEENRFIDAGQGATFSAGEVDTDGSHLHGVFVERRSPGGGTRSRPRSTASSYPAPAATASACASSTACGWSKGRTTRCRSSASTTSRIDRDLLPARQPFRERGESVRERTQPELWGDMRRGGDNKAAAEFHGRLARVMLLPLLPLMALPLGMASKRGQRAPGVVFGAAGADRACTTRCSSARASPPTAGRRRRWRSGRRYVLFGALGLWIFRGSLAWPGDNPVLRAVVAVEGLFEGLGRGGGRRPL